MMTTNKFIVIMADGLRWNYLDNDTYPGFKYFETNGVKAKYMEPVFPSNTYPNMYTLVTGLYPENHGFTDNVIFDETRNEWFLMYPHPNASHEHWWQGAEPIWVTATKTGLKCAAYWWFGSDVLIRGTKPGVCIPPKDVYGWSTLQEDVGRAFRNVLRSFKNNELDVVFLYYGDIDSKGHLHGPDSEELKQSLAKLDDIFVDLWKDVNDLDLQSHVNVMLISDHGMATTTQLTVKYIDLSDVIEPASVSILYGFGTTAAIYPVEDKIEEVYVRLLTVQGVEVYKKDDIPDKYHIRRGPHVPPIVVIAKEGYFLKLLMNNATYKFFKNIPDAEFWTGSHGYDTQNVDMRAYFAATGPDFKKNFDQNPMKAVDVYNIMCHILHLEPKPNNGNWDRVKNMLAL